jgi:pterin-4a-carbinolamine dehydratase
MTYEAYITITMNWNIDKRLLLQKIFEFNTFDEACDFFESKGILLKDEYLAE